MVFDITTREKALEFLASFLNLDIITISNFAFSATTFPTPSEPYRHDGALDIEAFLEENEIDIDKISIDNILFMAIHVTTDDDNCRSITKLGIVNLQEVLIQDTPIKRYLEQNGVNIDIKNHIITILGEEHFLSYDSALNSFEESLRYYLNRIAYKLYIDYAVNGFFYCNDIKSYGSRIYQGPEILIDISSLHPLLNNILDMWALGRKCYFVKYLAPIKQFQKMSFYDNEEDEKARILKIWMIKEALESIKDECDHGKVAYMNPEKVIAPQQIVEIKEYIV